MGDLSKLCDSLMDNTSFKGGIDLSNNNLNDEASILLSKLIKTNKQIK
jgi:hypothetical protein